MAFVRVGDNLINVEQVTHFFKTEFGAQFWFSGDDFTNVEGDFEEIVERIADAVDIYVDGPEPAVAEATPYDFMVEIPNEPAR